MNDRLAKVTICIGILTLALTSATHARSPHAIQKNKHCVVDVERMSPDGPQAYAADAVCYPTFSESIYAATGGAVLLPENETSEVQMEILERELDLLMATKATPSSSGGYVLSVDWDLQNYYANTSSIVFRGTQPCTFGWGYELSYMPGYWNDASRSSRGFSDCGLNMHYEHINWGGQVLVCTPDCPVFGALDKKVSSRRWYY